MCIRDSVETRPPWLDFSLPCPPWPGISVFLCIILQLSLIHIFLVTLEGTDYITASISIESYINLCLTMFIIFGCVFEMPLVTICLLYTSRCV